MPRFRNGIPLSASDMNLMSVYAQLVQDRVTGINYAIPYGVLPRTLLHKFRYLHYSFNVGTPGETTTVQLKINGTTEATFNWTSGVGYGIVAGSLDLASRPVSQGVPYEVTFTATAGSVPEILYIFELVESAPTLSFAGTLPTWSSTSTLAVGLDYLIESALNLPVSGFVSRFVFLGLSNYTLNWRIRHSGITNLHVRFEMNPGYNTTTVESRVYYNGAQLWTSGSIVKNSEGGSAYTYTLNLDISGLGLTIGTWYTVSLYMSRTTIDDFTGLLPVLIAEMSV